MVLSTTHKHELKIYYPKIWTKKKFYGLNHGFSAQDFKIHYLISTWYFYCQVKKLNHFNLCMPVLGKSHANLLYIIITCPANLQTAWFWLGIKFIGISISSVASWYWSALADQIKWTKAAAISYAGQHTITNNHTTLPPAFLYEYLDSFACFGIWTCIYMYTRKNEYTQANPLTPREQRLIT